MRSMQPGLKLANLLLALALALTPIYSFGSGGLQISHAIMVVYFAAILTTRRISIPWPAGTLLVLCGFILLREWASIVTGAGPENILEMLYVLFGALILLTLGSKAPDSSTLRALRFGTVSGIIIAVVGVILLGGASFKGANYVRAVGTFNNPNQLAYYALLSSSLAGLLYLANELRARTVLLVQGGTLFLALTALSKGGLIALFLGAIVLLWSVMARKASGAFATFLALGLSMTLLAFILAGVFDDYFFLQRLANIGVDSDDSLVDRGYLVWMDGNASHLLFGLGRDGVTLLLGHEIHSTFMAFFGKYGALGGMLFVSVIAYWIATCVRRFGWVGVLIIVVPPMLYGITHNGSRFTLFWVLMALTMTLRSARATATARSTDAGVGQTATPASAVGADFQSLHDRRG